MIRENPLPGPYPGIFFGGGSCVEALQILKIYTSLFSCMNEVHRLHLIFRWYLSISCTEIKNCCVNLKLWSTQEIKVWTITPPKPGAPQFHERTLYRLCHACRCRAPCIYILEAASEIVTHSQRTVFVDAVSSAGCFFYADECMHLSRTPNGGGRSFTFYWNFVGCADTIFVQMLSVSQGCF